jgi:2-phospho-L-lactate guanylyltransferase
VTVLPVDIPLATAEDVRDLVDTGATSDVVLAPARVDGGTNALYLSPPDAIPPRFGPASLRVHIGDAEAARLRCSILDLSRLALDLDTVEDALLIAQDTDSDAKTMAVLREILPELSGS